MSLKNSKKCPEKVGQAQERRVRSQRSAGVRKALQVVVRDVFTLDVTGSLGGFEQRSDRILVTF